MELDKIKLKALEDTLRLEKIDDKEYFSNKYAAYVSNSRLGNINPAQDGSPEKFFNKMQPIYSSSLELGSAVHAKVLQNELFELVEVDKPSAKLGFVCDYLWNHTTGPIRVASTDDVIAASQEIGYYKDSMNDKRIDDVIKAFNAYVASREKYKVKKGIEPMFLSHKMYETANKCIEACNNNKAFYKLMHPDYIVEAPISQNEQAFLLDIECNFTDKNPIILRLKAKLDNFVIDFENNTIVVNDLKTIGSVVSKFAGPGNNYERFRYCRELAIYLWLLKMYVKQQYNMTNPNMLVNCLVVSTVPNYYTKVYKATIKEIEEGFNEFRYLLKLVAHYIAYENYGFR